MNRWSDIRSQTRKCLESMRSAIVAAVGSLADISDVAGYMQEDVSAQFTQHIIARVQNVFALFQSKLAEMPSARLVAISSSRVH
jgi:enamine deaminase RidA (YjgF/YER057c/UK114 family)